TGSPSPAEHFVAPGIVDCAAQDLSRLLVTDRDAEKWILVRKIGCAVERIDNPLPRSLFMRSDLTGFLRENRVMRITLANAANDGRSAFLVGRGDQICPPLELDVLLAPHVMLQDVACGSSQFYGEIEIFHYLSCVLEALEAAMRSINFRKPSSAARALK